MSPRLLRPKSGGLHAEAADWRNRVIANGGSVSSGTLKAVSDFCKAVSAAGIRDRFYRLNLFCGSNLAACLVPLYRGPATIGAQYGNVTDLNNNFVSGDYAETGTGGGLATGTSNSTKTLDTGLIPFNAGIDYNNSHASYYSRQGNTSSNTVIGCGVAVTSTAHMQLFIAGTSGSVPMYYRSGGSSNSGIEAQNATRTGHIIAQRNSGGGVMYRNGANLNLTSTTTNNVTWTTNRPPAVRIFARRFLNNNVDTTDQYINTTLQAYSLGLALTDSQASAFYTALQTFQTALGRQL